MKRLLALVLIPACLPALACRVAPKYPIPDPLPEVLEWTRPASAGAPAFLGLKVRENASGGLESLAFDPGVRVVGVTPASPASEAGFRVGDVLLAWDDLAVDDPAALEALLRDAPRDDPEGVTPRLRVQRGDSVFELAVALRFQAAGGSVPGEAPNLLWRSDPSRSRAGWLAGHGGVVLVTSDPKGPFVRAGIEPGSVLTAVDGVPVRSERALIRSFQERPPGSKVRVTYRPPGSASDGPERDGDVRLFGPSSRVLEASLPVVAGYHSSADGAERSFYLLDLWVISLFKYRRDGEERHWSLLRFIRFSSGVGALVE